jgi:hypothetical protein
MKLTSIVAVAALFVAATALAADTTKFVTKTGPVSVSIRIATLDSQVPGPGDSFDAIVTIANYSLDRIELLAPTFEIRCPVNGVGTSWHVEYQTHAVIPAGKVVQEVLRLQVPPNADAGARMNVGLVVGLMPNANDFRTISSAIDLAPLPAGPLRDWIEKTRNGR